MLPFICYSVPEKGIFTIWKEYSAYAVIDAWKVKDDTGMEIFFSDTGFQASFTKNNIPVTSDFPMLNDRNIYQVYLLCGGSKPLKEEIRAYSKACNVNYLQANKKLVQGSNFIFKGDAYGTRDMLVKLQNFKVKYNVVPPYPHSLGQI